MVFAALWVVISALSPRSWASDAKSFLWEVTSDTATVFVMGSIHAAKPEFYPLNPVIENAFKQSSCLVVEVNPSASDEKKIQAIIEEKGFYPENDQIKNHIEGPLYKDLLKYLAKNGIPLERVSRMRPGFLSFTLTAAHIIKLGYLPEHGVDLYFLNKARESKQILELETLEEQMELLLDMPHENLFLKYTLADLDHAEQMLLDMSSDWLNGDTEGIYNNVIQPFIGNPEMMPLMNRLFFERNRKMTSKIKELLKGDRTCFVVVGAGHLVGDKGIIELLKQGQYNIRQLRKS
jgi:hypothetical protein